MSRVLETRTIAQDVKRRRYERADGSRFTTIEVPQTVIARFSSRQLKEAIEKWARGEQIRSLARQRRTRVEHLLREGVKPTAIAHELGVTDQRVRQIRKAILSQL